MEHCWNDSDQGKLKYVEKNLLNFTVSNINPTRDSLGSNLDLHGEGLVSNHLSHGTAHSCSASQ